MHEHLSPNELMELYHRILERLKQPFPEGTVEFNKDAYGKPIPYSAHIPVQAYIHKLNQDAGPFWSYRRSGPAVIHKEEGLIEVTVVLRILDSEREGTGFAPLTIEKDRIKNLKNATKAAISDALRDACDQFEMGWQDLAPYRSWANNPGVGLKKHPAANEEEQRPSQHKCVVCGEYITQEDLKKLAEYDLDRILWCFKHLPKHIRRKQ